MKQKNFFLLLALSLQWITFAQCNVSVLGLNSNNYSQAIVTSQSFTSCATGPLQNITFKPTGAFVDDYRATGFFIFCKLKDASNNLLATATFNGSSASTDQWYNGATVVANFNNIVTLLSGTTYIFELTSNFNDITYLFSRTTTSSYSGGNYISDGVAQPNQDLIGWTVNITTATLDTNSNILENGLKVYPNPTTGFVDFDLLDVNSAKIQVSDLTGKLLKSVNIEKNNNKINISNLSKGVYLLKIETEKGSFTKKIIKE